MFAPSGKREHEMPVGDRPGRRYENPAPATGISPSKWTSPGVTKRVLASRTLCPSLFLFVGTLLMGLEQLRYVGMLGATIGGLTSIVPVSRNVCHSLASASQQASRAFSSKNVASKYPPVVVVYVACSIPIGSVPAKNHPLAEQLDVLSSCFAFDQTPVSCLCE